MSKAHQQSLLSIQDISRAIDDNTAELFHYDISPNGVKGLHPIDDLYDDSLVCWLEMNNQNPAGTYVIDKSRYGNHGNIVGPTLANGRNGKALNFDGTGDYIKLTNLPFSSLTSCTIAFWLKLDTVKDWLIARGQTTGYYIMATSGGTGAFYHGSIGTFSGTIYCDGVATTTPIADTNWHYYVMSGVNLGIWTELYINNYSGWHLNGTLDSFMIFNRALTLSEVSNLYNQSIYSVRAEGKYGSSILVEDSTTNTWTGNFTVYNNYSVPYSFTDTGEKYLGQPIYRLAMTVDDAHSSALSNFQTVCGSHGVYSPSSYTYLANTKYAASVYWRPINKPDTVMGVASNIGGWTQLTSEECTDGWKRFTTTRNGTVTTDKTDRIYFGFRCPSLALNETIYIDWCCPQLEAGKDSHTSYVYGSRVRGLVNYQNPLQGLTQGTISCWAKKSPLNIEGGTLLAIDNTVNANSSLTIDFYSASMRFFIYDDAGASHIITANVSTDNNWHMYTFTFNGNQINGYIDGISYGSTSYTAFTCNGMLRLCQRGNPDYSSSTLGNFSIDELRIDKVARTAEEIISWYIGSTPFFPRGNEKITL